MADSSHAIIYLMVKIKSRGYLFLGSLGKLNYKFMITDLLAAKILQENHFINIHVILFICISNNNNNNNKKGELGEAKEIIAWARHWVGYFKHNNLSSNGFGQPPWGDSLMGKIPEIYDFLKKKNLMTYSIVFLHFTHQPMSTKYQNVEMVIYKT